MIYCIYCKYSIQQFAKQGFYKINFLLVDNQILLDKTVDGTNVTIFSREKNTKQILFEAITCVTL